jgi:hypothetical protein
VSADDGFKNKVIGHSATLGIDVEAVAKRLTGDAPQPGETPKPT